MKNRSRAYLVIGISLIISSLLWFRWVESTVMGVIWLCLGLVQLVIAFIVKRKEKK